jgi:nucleoside 2-deoxyribosyltransferase
MTIKIYLASRFSRIEQMQDCKKRLEAAGHKVVSRWVNGSHKMWNPESGDRFAREDLIDIAAANVLIGFTEPPRSHSSGGRHVELGFALASESS